MGKVLKYLGFMLVALFIYSNVHTGIGFSLPMFLAIFAMVIFWKITFKIFGLLGKIVLFFVAFMFFQY
ncbi:hypothetical protein [Enterococcus faecalis]|uniref:hypothetical protein n=1 Tax=Enterococcus faecalis TaxID=1351 RepID=UPI002DB6ED69|nr:hypothetical protein [Enterococcus faecalis]MEB7792067.1 hypothetical protein [Enterococcus faecalis]MEB7810055.1 hypothetical protein [Enterococcus faecalis]